MISQQDVEFYNENGYLVVENVLSAEQLATLEQELDELISQAAEVSENNEVYDLESSHSPQQPRVRRIKEPHHWLTSVERLQSDDNIIAILTRLMGPDIRLQTSKLNMKSARYGAPVQWHQDWAFYPHTNQNLLAAGIMLDDMTMDNGPLMVLPGSHRGPVYSHHHDGYFCGAVELDECDADFARAVPLIGPAGSVSFHHVRALHGSAMNYSSQPRRLLLFQYTAVDAWPLVKPVTDLHDYDQTIIAGRATLQPRLEDVPVRLPLPPAPHQGSIYENQRSSGQRFFEEYQKPSLEEA